MQPAPSANPRPSSIGGPSNETNSAGQDRRGVMENADGLYPSALTDDRAMQPSMTGEAREHRRGERNGTAGTVNTSSRRQVRTYNLPNRPNRFVSSSNFVEGHPGFQHSSFQQTGYQQTGFQHSSFEQSDFQESSLQRTNLQQSSLQESRMRNMFEGSSSAETEENLQRESSRHEQSRTRNMFDGSSSAATPSSQRRDIHGVPYTSSVLPTEPQTGRRMDEEVGSSLADNSDAGSVSYSTGIVFHDADAAPGIRHTEISIPVTPIRRIPAPMRLPPPPPEEGRTWSELLTHPPHPRYQHQFRLVEDENRGSVPIPENQFSPGSTMTKRDAHDDLVEGTMASYTHPRPLSGPIHNPFVTPPPRFLLGGRRGEDDDMMVGRYDVSRMRNANVASGDRAVARLAADERDKQADVEADDESDDERAAVSK